MTHYKTNNRENSQGLKRGDMKGCGQVDDFSWMVKDSLPGEVIFQLRSP